MSEEVRVLGCDIAAGGDAQTVVAVRVGWEVTKLHAWREADTMETVTRIVSIAAAIHPTLIVIDATGVGAGPFDRLRELGLPMFGFNGGEGTDATDASGAIRFLNKRAHAWWHLRELLHPMNPTPVTLPNDPELLRDLVAPRYSTEAQGGRLRLEKKTEVAKRIGRSPDKGDAVVLAFYDQDWSVFETGYTVHTPQSLKEELAAKEREERERAGQQPMNVDGLLFKDVDKGRWIHRDQWW